MAQIHAGYSHQRFVSDTFNLISLQTDRPWPGILKAALHFHKATSITQFQIPTFKTMGYFQRTRRDKWFELKEVCFIDKVSFLLQLLCHFLDQ
jgi:hypothetical protein